MTWIVVKDNFLPFDTMTGTTICSGTKGVTTTIELRGAFGNLPDLVLINSVRNGTGGLLHDHFNLTTNKGTKENAVCSNHGLCEHETGTCKCFATSVGIYTWDSSDGYGNRGLRGDCGYKVLNAQSCPNLCSFRGICNTTTYNCECYAGYGGPDCSRINCPTGPAWFDEPTANNQAHAPGVECSNRGLCDYTTGECCK